MSKPDPDKLLRLWPLLTMLAAEPFRAYHAGRIRRTHPDVCLELGHTDPPMCAHSLQPLTHCNGKGR